MFLSIKEILHEHKWSEWEESAWNKHYWSHTVSMYRYCRECEERQERVIEIHCRTFIRTGEYCYSCKPYVKDWEGRSIDFSQQMEDNSNMKTGKRRMGRPMKIATAVAMAIEYEWYPPISVREVGKKYGYKDPSASYQMIQTGRKYMNKEAVEAALKKR